MWCARPARAYDRGMSPRFTWALIAVGLLFGCDDGTTGGDAGGDAGTGSDGGTGGAPLVHRATGATCPADRGPGDFSSGAGGDCDADTDCTTGTQGRCLVSRGGAVLNSCSYDECHVDADCAAGSACDCRADASSNAPNRCLGGDCVLDSDCGAGGYCSPSVAFDQVNYPVVGTYCHTAADTCVNDEDCTPASARCAFDPSTAHWACSDEQFLPP